LKEFAIFDDQEVLEITKHESRLYRAPSEKMREFKCVFEEQNKFALNLKDILK